MMLATTLLVLAVWLAFIWFADPDGFRDPPRRLQSARLPARR